MEATYFSVLSPALWLHLAPWKRLWEWPDKRDENRFLCRNTTWSGSRSGKDWSIATPSTPPRPQAIASTISGSVGKEREGKGDRKRGGLEHLYLQRNDWFSLSSRFTLRLREMLPFLCPKALATHSFSPSTVTTEGAPRSLRQETASSRMPLVGACTCFHPSHRWAGDLRQLGEPGGNTVLGSQHICWLQKAPQTERCPHTLPAGALPVLVIGGSDPLRNYCASFWKTFSKVYFIFFFLESDFVRGCNFHVSRGKIHFGREMWCCEDPGTDCLTRFALCLSPFMFIFPYATHKSLTL